MISYWKFDMTGLRHAKGQQDLVARDDYNTYYINVGGEVSEASQAECAGASVCQLTMMGDHKNAGTLSSQTFSAPASDVEPGKGIVVTYSKGDACSSGDNRATSILIQCDPLVEDPIFKPVEESTHCTYAVTMTSKYGCGKKSSSGGETFALVLLLILVCGFILYFLVGIIYQKKVKGATGGKELIIHNEFWFSLPGLVKDGVQFIFHCCKKGDYVNV